MTVRFFELTRDGSVPVGDITLKDGKLTAKPTTEQALINLLGQPFELWNPRTGEREYVEPYGEPERFLRGCLDTYKGSYFWCREIEG